MKRIGLISDTHSYLDNEIIGFLKDVDEIWHAGDIGNEDVLDYLESIKTVRAVYGNIDDFKIRQRTNYNLRFKIEEVSVYMIHIGGYPDKYIPEVKKEIIANSPDLFISGHSHILKIIHDKKFNLLHINPGAAGKYGWHKFITAICFEIEGKKIQNIQIFEKQRQ
ncbi:MAG: metallophosphoesterase family protein [Bacteroidales bacterium]|nr:metallophosphoesterase family protein [Bacteroidales bacterium]